MTVAVLGPGAVGAALAVPLALMGEDVICVGRTETADAIASEGLTLVRLGETFHARPEATDVLRDDVDLLLVTVKAPALADALARVQANAVTTVPFLNGLEHVDNLRTQLTGRVVAGSIGLLEAYRETPTRVVQTTRGPVLTLAEPVDIAGFDVRVTPERELLWDKAARMAPLAAATAATQRSVGDLRDDPEWRAQLALAIDEACNVAEAEGVKLEPASQWEIIERMPETMTTSTARDVAAGRPSELDAITGAVVRAGRRAGVPTPTLERLLEDACRA